MQSGKRQGVAPTITRRRRANNRTRGIYTTMEGATARMTVSFTRARLNAEGPALCHGVGGDGAHDGVLHRRVLVAVFNPHDETRTITVLHGLREEHLRLL